MEDNTFKFIANYAPTAVETYVLNDVFGNFQIEKVEQILVGEIENGIMVTRFVTCTSWGCRSVENDDDNLFYLTAQPVSDDTLADFSTMFYEFMNMAEEELADLFIEGFKAWGFKYVINKDGEKMTLEDFCIKKAKEVVEKEAMKKD